MVYVDLNYPLTKCQVRSQDFVRGGGHKVVQLGDIYTQIHINIFIQILQEGARAPGAPPPPSGYALEDTLSDHFAQLNFCIDMFTWLCFQRVSVSD